MTQTHRNQAGEFPRAPVVFGQNRPVVQRVLEEADTSDLETREIPHRCARADQALRPFPLLAHAAQTVHNFGTAGDVAGCDQT